MKNKNRKIIRSGTTLFLIVSLISPIKIFAEEEVSNPTPTPVLEVQENVPSDIPVADQSNDLSPVSIETQISPAVLIEENASALVTQSSVTSQENDSPQNVEVSQESAGGTSLESTFDPHNTTVVEEVVSNDQSSSTPTISTPIELPRTGNVDQTPIVEVTPEVVNIEVVTPSANIPVNTPTNINETVMNQPTVTITQVMQVEEAEPEPEFTFEVKNNYIPTKEKPDWQKSDKEIKNKKLDNQITNIPNLSSSESEGTLDISGNCSDPYFVILVYTKPEEYDKNPGSYIFNKAFECIDGEYAYSLKDLPEKLKDGTYYLLVAGQGNSGSWKPITALIPININNQNEQ